MALTVVVAAGLQPLMHGRRRASSITIADDEVSTIGHVVGSLGIPLTEVGELRVAEAAVDPGWQPTRDAVVEVLPRHRPQATPTFPPRFALDVHLGTLARRMRVLGIDTVWRNDMTDDGLLAFARDDQRVILTRDRGLLLRHAARDGAYVWGNDPDDQLDDVLHRFTPPLAPWTRCTSCNGRLGAVDKAEVVERLQPGTRRTYDGFARCDTCARMYWAGAHHDRLQRVVDRALALEERVVRV